MLFQTHLENLKNLNLPEGEFVIISSGGMAVRGIREARDLDVLALPTLWSELIKKYPVIVENGIPRIKLENDIEILDPEYSIFGNSSVVPLTEMLEKADIFNGTKYVNLEHLKKIKLAMGREKDLKDIELIDAYLKTNS